MSRCRISEEDAGDAHFDMMTEEQERQLEIEQLIDRRETIKEWVHGAKEKIDRLLSSCYFNPDSDDIECAETLNDYLDWHIFKIKDIEEKKKNGQT